MKIQLKIQLVLFVSLNCSNLWAQSPSLEFIGRLKSGGPCVVVSDVADPSNNEFEGESLILKFCRAQGSFFANFPVTGLDNQHPDDPSPPRTTRREAYISFFHGPDKVFRIFKNPFADFLNLNDPKDPEVDYVIISGRHSQTVNEVHLAYSKANEGRLDEVVFKQPTLNSCHNRNRFNDRPWGEVSGGLTDVELIELCRGFRPQLNAAPGSGGSTNIISFDRDFLTKIRDSRAAR